MRYCSGISKYILLGLLVYAAIFWRVDYYFPRSSSFSPSELLSLKFFAEESEFSLNETTNHVAQFRDKNYTYNFLKTPKDRGKCDSNTSVLMIVLSVADHFEIRNAIRNTYGNSNNSKSIEENRIRINFIFSLPNNSVIRDKIEDEFEKSDDLIITDLPETYDNLILKVYSLLGYSKEYCNETQYVMKIDEDVIVDVDSMFSRFSGNPMFANSHSISCYIWRNALPKRDRTNKWYVPRTFWPSKYFPNYCDGPMYLIGKSAIPKLLEEARNHNIWKLEDVFWTGIVAQNNKISRLDWTKHLLRFEQDLSSKKRMRCALGKPLIFGCHGLKGSNKIAQGYAMLRNFTC